MTMEISTPPKTRTMTTKMQIPAKKLTMKLTPIQNSTHSCSRNKFQRSSRKQLPGSPHYLIVTLDCSTDQKKGPPKSRLKICQTAPAQLKTSIAKDTWKRFLLWTTTKNGFFRSHSIWKSLWPIKKCFRWLGSTKRSNANAYFSSRAAAILIEHAKLRSHAQAH